MKAEKRQRRTKMERQRVNDQVLVKNSRGKFVAESTVKPLDALRDQMVEMIFSRIKDLEDLMKKTKRACFDDINAYQKTGAEIYGVDLTSEKGNYNFTSFDGTKKIKIYYSNTMDIKPEISLAKTLIDDYLNSELSSSSDGIKAIVSGAFQLNQNRYDAKRLLDLKNYNITDERWKKAMEIINDSVTTTLTCRCIAFQEKIGELWVSKNLNFSSITDNAPSEE
jgi:hypothetical protein